MGVVNAASPFLPVLVARLGGTAFTISLLTSIPAVAGFTLAIPIGQFLQRRGQRRQVVRHRAADLEHVVCADRPDRGPRTERGRHPDHRGIWAVAAIPSTMGMVLFPIVMDGAAGTARPPRADEPALVVDGPDDGHHRLDHRHLPRSGADADQLRDRVHVVQRSAASPASSSRASSGSRGSSRRRAPIESPSLRERFRSGRALMRSQPAFLQYSIRQLVYVSRDPAGAAAHPALLRAPWCNAPDAWIGIIATGQSLALLGGYQFWKRQSRIRGHTDPAAHRDARLGALPGGALADGRAGRRGGPGHGLRVLRGRRGPHPVRRADADRAPRNTGSRSRRSTRPS